jgi:F-type H+-transporting ATPase subunit gamma
MEEEVTKDLIEFALANAIFAALVEAHACEQSARYDRLPFLCRNIS